MRYDAEHKQKTRDKVLNVAAKAIRRDGPHKVAVAEIMSEAGLTHGGFYAHFSSKDDLIVQAIGQMFDTAAVRRFKSYGDLPPPEALNAYIDFYLSPAHRDARDQGCPMPALSADLPRLPAAAQERFALGLRNLTGMIGEKLELLGRPQAQDLASSVVAELVGAVALARAEPDIERSDRMLERSRHFLKQRLGLES